MLRYPAGILFLALCLASIPDPLTSQPPVESLDPLPPDLRAEVEWLKGEVARHPSTAAQDLSRRIDVLWRWANGLALAGHPIPQELPVLAAVRDDIADRSSAEAWLGALDGWVRELQLKEEIPGLLGSLRLSHRGPLPARSWQTLEQTWTVGALGMRAGGGIEVGIDGFNDQGVLQSADPARDNFLSVRSSNPNARFRLTPGHAGLSLTTRVALGFILEGTDLAPGETVTLVYGDRSGGSRGFQLQSWSIDELRLPLYLDLEGTGHFFTPGWPSLEVVGMAEVERVRGMAPSVLATGETFALALRSEDRFYNRSSGSIPAYEVRLGETLVARTAAGDRGLVLVPGLHIDEPGVHRFALRSADGRLEGSSNPIWVEERPKLRVFWGDTHGHTQYSEGQGSADGYFRFARDDAGLDFVVLSEHDIWTDDAEWESMRRLSEAYLVEGSFVPFVGYEWTRPPASGGHHNVFFRRDVPWRIPAQIAPELGRLYAALRRAYPARDTMVVPHAHAPGDWRQSDPEIEKLIEIASTHGTFEFFGNRYLEQGWQVGFIGSTDNHHGHPGYPDTGTTFHTERAGLAAVLAAAKTPEALFEAMHDLRAYATSGGRILLDARLDQAPIGSRLDAEAQRRLSVRASAERTIGAIDVVKNGDVVYHRDFLQTGLTPDARVLVTFASSSEVEEFRRPRGRRIWKGWLEVQGAVLEEFEVLSAENRHLERIEASPERKNRLDFYLFTRGRGNMVLLALAGASPRSSVALHLDASTIAEGSSAGEPLPAADLELRLGAAAEAPLVQRLEEGGGSEQDTITVQIVDPDRPLDQELEWTDLAERAPGDYYYVRVTQIDGERAWSSPFWVGERAEER